jgi:hypothetical protein
MSKIKKLFAALLLLGLVGPALAQQAVSTLPSARVTTDASSTIAVTDTFQQIWAAQSSRVGCGIQNNSTGTMWVYFGSGTPTKATSVVLAPGQFLNCATSGIVASSAVWITGTSSGVFYAGLDGAPIVGPPTTVVTTGSGVEQDVNLTQINGTAAVTAGVNGLLAVGGNVSSGVADAGNPVKIGCVYNSTRPTLTNGQRGDCQLSDRGAVGTFIQGPSGTTTVAVDGTVTDGVSGAGTLRVGSFPYAFNNSTWDRAFTCSNSAVIDVTGGATDQLVALSGSTVIRVCSYNVTASASATFTFQYGTGVTCGTGTTALTGVMQIAANASNGMSGMNGSLFRGAAANALCLAATGGNITGFVTYAQY